MTVMLVTLMWLLCWAQNSPAQVVVIGNPSVPADSIKKSLLLDLYTGDIKNWPDGQAVIVVDLKPRSEVKTTFYDYLGKSPSRMKSIWLRKMLSGEGDPPEAMNSEDELLRKVATTAGAIGFVGKSNLRQGVKVLLEILEIKDK